MKRIGIVTLYDNINIGNKLQNYAVQTYFENMGFECRTIEHWEMAHHKLNICDIKFMMYELIGFPKEKAQKIRLGKERKKRFKQFSDQYLKLGECVEISDVPKDLNLKYNYFVTGSDQVWHNWTKTKKEIDYFFLGFARPEQRISISPSFGKSSIEPEFKESYIKGLNGLEVLTCREKSGAALIYGLCGKEARVLLDPTMLIDTCCWEKMAKRPDILSKNDYILTYSLGGLTDEVSKVVYTIAKEYSYKIIDILDPKQPNLYLTTPDEFLYYIKNSKLVITDSFHACVFSILFNTDFVVFNRKQTSSMGNMESRLDTLLNKFSLLDRKFESISLDNLFKTDFSHVNQVLDVERKETRELYESQMGV